MERGVPILDQHGLPATFFIAANTSPVHLDYCSHAPWRKIEWNAADIKALKDMVRRGHEIGSHSVWHKNPEDPNTRPANDRGYDAKYEAEESERLISNWMDREIPSFCYPFCKKGGGLKEAVIAAGYKQARAGANGAYYQIGDSLDYFDIDCRHIGLDDRREDVPSWKHPSDRWHVLMFHGIGTTNDADGWWSISPEEFVREMSELAAYRDGGEVEVLTFADATKRMRTASQSGK
jgi:peptidoglycan/xylan/chitin deacetylase (PgdA/CDA1 family)